MAKIKPTVTVCPSSHYAIAKKIEFRDALIQAQQTRSLVINKGTVYLHQVFVLLEHFHEPHNLNESSIHMNDLTYNSLF